MKKTRLVFLYGPAAAGKLTVVRELAGLTGFRLFHNHLTVDLALSLFDFGTEPFVHLREEIWLAAFREAARRGVSLIFTFAPERTVRPRFVGDAEEAVGREGGEVLFVELTCDEAELERRIESPARARFGKLRSLAQYRELKNSGAFEFGGALRPALSLDTTHAAPDETARQIATHFSLA